MLLNIKVFAIPNIWLSLFPTKKHGEQKTPLKAPETLGVPPVPPFPRFFFTVTYGTYGNPGELTE